MKVYPDPLGGTSCVHPEFEGVRQIPLRCSIVKLGEGEVSQSVNKCKLQPTCCPTIIYGQSSKHIAVRLANGEDI